jgi:hypothetical protein
MAELTGSVRRQLFAEDGTLLLDQTDHNLEVTSGKVYLAAWLAAASQSGEFMSYIGLGTATTSFTINMVTDSTHLVVSSTTGMAPSDIITQGANTTTVTSVTDLTHVVVGNTAGFTASAATFQHLPNVGDTNLQTPLPTRVQGILSTPGSINIWQNVATFGPGVNTGAITEAGLFSTSSGGTMYARNVFSVVNKGAGNTFVVTWMITFN